MTGAWREGDPLGPRKLVKVVDGRPFHLEGGGVLHEITMAYETWGELDADASNAVLVCHALTGDSHASARGGRLCGRRKTTRSSCGRSAGRHTALPR